MVDQGEIQWALDAPYGDPTRLLLRTSVRGAMVPLAAMASVGAKIILASPAGAIAGYRFRPRAGPLFGRTTAEVSLISSDLEEVLDEAGELARAPR